MAAEGKRSRSFGSELGRRLGSFSAGEQGSFVVFSLFLLVAVFIVAGMAVDVVRYEAERTRLQNTLDRAILAAADMSQQMTAEAVVESYFEKADLEDYLASVETETGFNSKIVSATGVGTMDTMFMKLVGISQLDPFALGTAEESISDIEISLVLDVSGSMDEDIYDTYVVQTKYGSRTYRYNTGQTKMEALHDAAKEFVDTMFGSTAAGRTSMSLVPYASQVNVGPTLLSYYPVTTQNTVNTCVDFSDADFDDASIDPDVTLSRTDYFDMTSAKTAPPATPAVCDTAARSRIIPLSGDAEALKDAIDDLTPNGNTSVELGMKWGTALLDPETRSVVSDMIDDGHIDEAFEGRPFDYDNLDTMKVIVVMTDGINTDQWYLNSSYRSQLSGVYRWWNGSAWRWSVNAPEGSNISYDGDTTKNETYRRLNITSGSNMWASTPEGGAAATELTYRQLWQLMSIEYHAYYIRAGAYFKDTFNGSHTNSSSNSNLVSSGGTYATAKVTAATNAWTVSTVTDYYDNADKNARLDDICTAAKSEELIVFAIGFEVTDASAEVLEDCASSASHFYRVNGLEITTAFQSIANAIGKLRLTQ